MNQYVYQNALVRKVAAHIDALGRRLYKPRHSAPHNVRRIALFRLDQIGDAFYCTPLLDYLQGAFPDARIDIITTARNADIYAHHSFLGRIYTYNYPRFARGGKKDSFSYLINLVRELRARKYDIIIDPRGEPLVAILGVILGAKIRIGIEHEEVLSFLYTHPIRYNPASPAWHRFQAMLKTIGIDAPVWSPRIVLTPEEKDAAAHEAGKLGAFISLHLGAGMEFKRWPIPHFAEIAHRALERGMRVAVFGSREERALAEQLRRQGASFEDFSGKLSIRATYALLGHAAAFVGNDSALVHLAAPQGMPAAHLMSVISPRSAAALGPQVHILVGEDARHSCSADTCPYPCPHLASITPDEVATALGKVLA